MKPIEITLNRPGDKKTHLRAHIRCKWTPLSLQGEHFITTSLDDLLDYMGKNLRRFNEVSRINILHALGDLYDI